MIVSYKSTGQVATYQMTTFGGSLLKIEGYVNATDPVFLLFFDTKTGVTTTIKKTLQVLGADGFSFSYTDVGMKFTNGVFIALSSTENTYTAIGGGGVADLLIDFDQTHPTGLTIVGDYTTAVTSLLAWVAGDFSKLVRLEVSQSSGGSRWVQIHKTDAAPNGTVPMWSRNISTTSGVLDYNFGDDGFHTSPGDTTDCYIALSSTQLTLTLVVATEAKIRASVK